MKNYNNAIIYKFLIVKNKVDNLLKSFCKFSEILLSLKKPVKHDG